MLLTSGRGKNTFIEDLRLNLNNAKIVYIITAYITVGGLVDILPNIQGCQEVCIIVGDMSNKYCMDLQMQLMGAAPPTKKNANEVEILKRMVQDKRIKILFARDSEAKIIHSKGYLLELWSGEYISYIGSANLTHPGFFKNKEWMLKSTDLQVAQDIYKEFLEEWNYLSNQYTEVQNTVQSQINTNIGQVDSQYNNQNYDSGVGQVPMQNYYNVDNKPGISLGTIDGQDLRVGNGQLLSFLKSLF